MKKENSSYKCFSADRALYGKAEVYKPQFYFVEYNAVYIARYKTIKSCLNFIKRKNLKNDCNNVLRIWDNTGMLYDTTNGKIIEDFD
ncbi:MAG: hypothetical protein J6Y78_06155 [Paludibacteraceae bacterium]|nr:hypothetical protein [Paludibacteraceae bacterium]